MRRFLVPGFVAALIVGLAPSPSFGAADDHYRCMYHCDQRAGTLRPAHVAPSRPRPRPHPGSRPPARRCWLFCGDAGWRRKKRPQSIADK